MECTCKTKHETLGGICDKCKKPIRRDVVITPEKARKMGKQPKQTPE